MYTISIRNLLLVTILIGCLKTALAANELPDEAGFSGFVLFGGGYMDLKSNTAAGSDIISVGNRTIESITASPDSNDEVHPVLTGEIRYTLADRRMQFFAGNSVEDILELDFSQQLGIRRQLGDAGVVALSYLFTSFPAEVWEDPYVDGVPRVETDHDSSGVRLDWDQIAGTDFDLQLTYRDIDIDDERSGESLGLSAASRALLERDGDQYSLNFGFRWFVAPGHNIHTQLGIRDNDRNGDAMKHDRYWLQITYFYRRDRWTFSANGLLGSTDHEAENPVYNQRQDADQAVVSASLSYRLPIASQRWSVAGLVTYGDSDSDIDFFDSSVFSTIVGLSYRF